MSHTLGIRQAQKQKTRQALLDAALELLADQSLSSLGLREVTRAVGVAPTAFYRHFESTADLGVALVEEALGSLHAMIRDQLTATWDSDERITRTVELIVRHVASHPAHVRFLARERFGGVRPVREAIAAQLAQFVDEVGDALAREPQSAGWSADDLSMLARLYVDHMMVTAAELLTTAPEDLARVTDRAERQLRLVTLGGRHWLDAS
ncbi:TetR family transcriptional regulator [Streptomyces sp. SID5785]|uniref:TetR family transcriptional regulator n=1 Tax=Streptomyces sp. SID5785 TaxID=2690309 RepID=UPI001360EAC1|nr:TetR family transcriptional regulator [Streptomyces sp. SID5785]MZD05442.1 TetR family transcriptional regulator [Streptomyces sp. SID5785]